MVLMSTGDCFGLVNAPRGLSALISGGALWGPQSCHSFLSFLHTRLQCGDTRLELVSNSLLRLSALSESSRSKWVFGGFILACLSPDLVGEGGLRVVGHTWWYIISILVSSSVLVTFSHSASGLGRAHDAVDSAFLGLESHF